MTRVYWARHDICSLNFIFQEAVHQSVCFLSSSLLPEQHEETTAVPIGCVFMPLLFLSVQSKGKNRYQLASSCVYVFYGFLCLFICIQAIYRDNGNAVWIFTENNLQRLNNSAF